jgi:ATP phosphoribosyltransferase
MLTIAMAKGRIMDEAAELFQQAGFSSAEWTSDSRRLIHEVPQDGMRIMVVRATDVPAYVEHGAADIGIVGQDTLFEMAADVYEPLDLGIGRCRLSVARIKGDESDPQPLKVATKYPRLAEAYFGSRGRHIELIKLYGSIELAPLVGLADCIVDLVSSGRTLVENGLEEVAVIREIASSLIVNRASLKTKSIEVKSVIERLRPFCEKVAS